MMIHYDLSSDYFVDPLDISFEQIVFDPGRGRLCLFSNSYSDPDYWLLFPIYGLDRKKPYITKAGHKIYFTQDLLEELDYMNSLLIIANKFVSKERSK